MKKRLARELIWMALPATLLGGAAWWLGNGGRLRASTPDVGQLVSNARRPSLSLQKIEARWISPTERASTDSIQGCTVTAFISASAFTGQVQPIHAPNLVVTDLVDEKGHSLTSVLGPARSVAGAMVYSGIATDTTQSTAGGESVPDKYDVTAIVPLNRLPPSTRRATLTGKIVWGTARPVPVKFEVLPTWMRRPATRLRLERVVCNSYKENNGGEVEVVCRLVNPQNPYIFGMREDGRTYYRQFGIGYDPQQWRDPTHKKSDDTIVAEWSQRVESGDGLLNSLATSFDPLSTAPDVIINKDKIHLVYAVSRIPEEFVNPVFRCEIYLVNDGMVNVSCPLTTKPSAAAR